MSTKSILRSDEFSCPSCVTKIEKALSALPGVAAAILIKGGQHLEHAGRINMLALDKTGTLTEGKPSLTEIVPLGGIDRAELLHWTAIAESGSDHPLGRPIIEAARAEGALPAADKVEELAGMGLVAEHDGRQIAAGNRRLFDHLGISFDAPAEAALAGVMGRGRTPVIVALDGKLAGILGLSDQPRAMAAAAMPQRYAEPSHPEPIYWWRAARAKAKRRSRTRCSA